VERKRLNRDADHRKALLMNLAQELIKHEKIETTLVKAKYVKPYIEQLITKAKEATETTDKIRTFNIVKQIRTKLNSEELIRKLVEDLGPRYKGINGGYTRVARTRYRDGDKALMARIELTQREVKKEAKKEAKKVTKKNEKN